MLRERVYIYLLEYSMRDIIYIGSTTDPSRRLSEHSNPIRVGSFAIPVNNKITMTILEEVDRRLRYEREGFYIDLFKSWGFKLKNSDLLKNRERKEAYFHSTLNKK